MNFDNQAFLANERYYDLLKGAISTIESDLRQVLAHRDLFILFDFLVGGFPQTKIKLNKRLEHLGISISVLTVAGSSMRGHAVTWHATSEQLDTWKKLLGIDPARAA